MAATVQIIFTSDSAGVEKMLNGLYDALDTVGIYEYLNESVGPWLRERAQARFDNEGDDVVGKWAPLEAYTVAIRQSEGYGGDHPINVRSGELESYIVNGGWDVSSGVGVATLTYPGNLPSPSEAVRVATAQIGASYPSTPPRPVLGLNTTDLSFALASLATHVTLAARMI